MQPRNSLNLRQRPLRPQKDERPITMKNINLKENGSLSDLSSIQVNDDLNLLSPDMYEEKSTRSKNLKKYFEEYSKSNKSKGRESLMSKFEKNINPF